MLVLRVLVLAVMMMVVTQVSVTAFTCQIKSDPATSACTTGTGKLTVAQPILKTFTDPMTRLTKQIPISQAFLSVGVDPNEPHTLPLNMPGVQIPKPIGWAPLFPLPGSFGSQWTNQRVGTSLNEMVYPEEFYSGNRNCGTDLRGDIICPDA